MLNWRRSLTLIAPWAVAILVLAWGYQRVPPRYTYTADSFMRYFQAQGFRLTGEDTLLYAFADVDAEYRYYPLRTSNYLIRDQGGKWRAPFPFAFAAPAAGLLALAGRDYAPLFSGLAFLLLLAVFQRGFRLRPPALLLAAAATALPIYALDFGEVIYATLLAALGLTCLKPAHGAAFWRGAAGGALIGIAAWLRLETLALAAAAAAGSAIAAGRLRPVRLAAAVREPGYRRIAGFITGVAAATVLLCAYNYANYGLLFGPKLAADHASVGALARRAEIAQSLLLGAETFGTWKPGFLGLTPLFALAFLPCAFGRLRAGADEWERTLLWTLPIFSGLTLLTAPHDGAWSWGARYLTMGIPLALVTLDRLFARASACAPPWRFSIYAACGALAVFSFFEMRRGVQILHGAADAMKHFEAAAVNARGDLRIFDNPAVAFQLGPEYLESDGVLLRDTASLAPLLPLIEARYAGREAVYFSAPFYDLARSQFLPDDAPLDRDVVLQALSRKWTRLPDPPSAPGLLLRRYRIPAP